MKKSRKIFGAVALSAVLAFGTAVPAFADNNTNLNSGDVEQAQNQNGTKEYNENDAGASTTVNIATYSSHYSVTVPVKLPFMLDQIGGEGISPTNYYIQNNGEDAAVEVYAVTWELDGANNQTGAANEYYYTFGKTTGLVNSSPVVQSRYGATFGSLKDVKYGSFTIEATSGTGAAFNTVATWDDGNGEPAAVTLPDGTTKKDGSRYGTKEFANGEWKIAKATTQTTASPAVVWDSAQGKFVPNTDPDALKYTKDPIALKITGTALGKHNSVSVDEKTIEDVASIMYTIGFSRTV